MPAERNAAGAYGATQNSSLGPREIEARALIKAATLLEAAQKDPVSEDFKNALRMNWRLWTIFQADLTSPNNPLPDEIKANVLSLSIFVDKQTMSALYEPTAQKAGILININRNLAAGLLQRPQSASPQSGPTLPPSGGPISA